MAQRPFRGDENIVRARSITEQRVCGLEQPLIVAAMIDGQVRITPRATIDCPMAMTIEAWLTHAVEPSAMARLGSPVVGIRQMGGYDCRTIMNRAGAELSEHAFGNALDIAAFELADGRVVSILDDWHRGTPAERDFLRDVHYSACPRARLRGPRRPSPSRSRAPQRGGDDSVLPPHADDAATGHAQLPSAHGRCRWQCDPARLRSGQSGCLQPCERSHPPDRHRHAHRTADAVAVNCPAALRR